MAHQLNTLPGRQRAQAWPHWYPGYFSRISIPGRENGYNDLTVVSVLSSPHSTKCALVRVLFYHIRSHTPLINYTHVWFLRSRREGWCPLTGIPVHQTNLHCSLSVPVQYKKCIFCRCCVLIRNNPYSRLCACFLTGRCGLGRCGLKTRSIDSYILQLRSNYMKYSTDLHHLFTLYFIVRPFFKVMMAKKNTQNKADESAKTHIGNFIAVWITIPTSPKTCMH